MYLSGHVCECCTKCGWQRCFWIFLVIWKNWTPVTVSWGVSRRCLSTFHRYRYSASQIISSLPKMIWFVLEYLDSSFILMLWSNLSALVEARWVKCFLKGKMTMLFWHLISFYLFQIILKSLHIFCQLLRYSDDLHNCIVLEELWIIYACSCYIKIFIDFQSSLKSMSELVELSVDGNPFCNHLPTGDALISVIQLLLPNLHMLDSVWIFIIISIHIHIVG